MNGILTNVFLIARKDLRDALASRWFILYTIAFAGLGLCVAYVSAGASGLSGFGRTSAGLINLVLLVVPLMGLTAGAGAVAGDRERGMLAYLLAQPISRFEYITGRYVALAVALAMSISIGFGISAAAMAMKNATTEIAGYLLLVGLTVALAMAMLSVGMLISVLVRRTAVATGAAVFVWLVLVFGTDLGIMAGTLSLSLSIESLLGIALANPLQVFKMASLQFVDASLDVLGPAGLYAQTEYARSLPWIFASVLLAWIVLPLASAWVAMVRRSPV